MRPPYVIETPNSSAWLRFYLEHWFSRLGIRNANLYKPIESVQAILVSKDASPRAKPGALCYHFTAEAPGCLPNFVLTSPEQCTDLGKKLKELSETITVCGRDMLSRPDGFIIGDLFLSEAMLVQLYSIQLNKNPAAQSKCQL